MNTRAFLLALSFLTRVPVPAHATPEPEDYGASVVMYPLVGLLLGLMLIAVAGLVTVVGGTPLVAAVVVTACWAGVTGALHLDGLADSADAWLGGHGDRERTLTIMKDPTAGPAGVVAVVLILLLKTAAVTALLELPGWAWPLLLAPALGRSACALLFVLLPYVRPAGLGASGAATVHAGPVRAVTAGVAILTLALSGLTGIAMLIAGAVALWWARNLMRERIAGFTGDTAGATVEIVEAAILLAASLALAHT